MILKLIAELDLEVDGSLEKEKAIEILAERSMPKDILSEDYDGTKDWAIIINSWTIREEGR